MWLPVMSLVDPNFLQSLQLKEALINGAVHVLGAVLAKDEMQIKVVSPVNI